MSHSRSSSVHTQFPKFQIFLVKSVAELTLKVSSRSFLSRKHVSASLSHHFHIQLVVFMTLEDDVPVMYPATRKWRSLILYASEIHDDAGLVSVARFWRIVTAQEFMTESGLSAIVVWQRTICQLATDRFFFITFACCFSRWEEDRWAEMETYILKKTWRI